MFYQFGFYYYMKCMKQKLNRNCIKSRKLDLLASIMNERKIYRIIDKLFYKQLCMQMAQLDYLLYEKYKL